MAAPADLVGAVAEAEAVLRGHRVWDVTDVFNAARHLATAIRNSMTLTQTHPDDPVFLRALRARGVVLATLCRIQHPDRLGLCVDQASQNYGYLQKRMALTGVPDMRAHVTVLECAAYRAANDTMAYQKAVTALQLLLKNVEPLRWDVYVDYMRVLLRYAHSLRRFPRNHPQAGLVQRRSYAQAAAIGVALLEKHVAREVLAAGAVSLPHYAASLTFSAAFAAVARPPRGGEAGASSSSGSGGIAYTPDRQALSRGLTPTATCGSGALVPRLGGVAARRASTLLLSPTGSEGGRASVTASPPPAASVVALEPASPADLARWIDSADLHQVTTMTAKALWCLLTHDGGVDDLRAEADKILRWIAEETQQTVPPPAGAGADWMGAAPPPAPEAQGNADTQLGLWHTTLALLQVGVGCGIEPAAVGDAALQFHDCVMEFWTAHHLSAPANPGAPPHPLHTPAAFPLAVLPRAHVPPRRMLRSGSASAQRLGLPPLAVSPSPGPRGGHAHAVLGLGGSVNSGLYRVGHGSASGMDDDAMGSARSDASSVGSDHGATGVSGSAERGGAAPATGAHLHAARDWIHSSGMPSPATTALSSPSTMSPHYLATPPSGPLNTGIKRGRDSMERGSLSSAERQPGGGSGVSPVRLARSVAAAMMQAGNDGCDAPMAPGVCSPTGHASGGSAGRPSWPASSPTSLVPEGLEQGFQHMVLSPPRGIVTAAFAGGMPVLIAAAAAGVTSPAHGGGTSLAARFASMSPAPLPSPPLSARGLGCGFNARAASVPILGARGAISSTGSAGGGSSTPVSPPPVPVVVAATRGRSLSDAAAAVATVSSDGALALGASMASTVRDGAVEVGHASRRAAAGAAAGATTTTLVGGGSALSNTLDETDESFVTADSQATQPASTPDRSPDAHHLGPLSGSAGSSLNRHMFMSPPSARTGGGGGTVGTTTPAGQLLSTLSSGERVLSSLAEVQDLSDDEEEAAAGDDDDDGQPRGRLRPVSGHDDMDEGMAAAASAVGYDSAAAPAAFPRPPPLPVRGLTDGSFTIGPLPSPGGYDASGIPRLMLPASLESPRGRPGRAGSVTAQLPKPKGSTPSLAVIVRLLELNLQGLEDSLASLGVTVVNGAFITAASVPLPEEGGAEDGSSAGGASPRDGPAVFTRGWSMSSPVAGLDASRPPTFPSFTRRGARAGSVSGAGVAAGSMEAELEGALLAGGSGGGGGGDVHAPAHGDAWRGNLADVTPQPQAKRHRRSDEGGAASPTQPTQIARYTPSPPTATAAAAVPAMRTPSPPARSAAPDARLAGPVERGYGAGATAGTYDGPAQLSPGRAADAIRPLPATPPRPSQSTPPRAPTTLAGPPAVAALLRSASAGSGTLSSPSTAGSPMVHGTPQGVSHGGGASAPGSASHGTPQHTSAFSAAKSPARVGSTIMSPSALARAPSSSSTLSVAGSSEGGGAAEEAHQPRVQAVLRLAGAGGGGLGAGGVRRPPTLPGAGSSQQSVDEDVAMTPLGEAQSPLPSPAAPVRGLSTSGGRAGSRGGAPISTLPASTPLAATLARPGSAGGGIIRSTSAMSASSTASAKRVTFSTTVLHVEESRRRARLASMEELPYNADGTTSVTVVEGEAMVSAVAAAHAEISLEVEAVAQAVVGRMGSPPGWSSPRMGPGRAITPTQGLHLSALSPLLSASLSSLNVSFASDDGGAGSGGGGGGGGGGSFRTSQSPFTLPQSQASAASSTASAAAGEGGARVAGSHVVMSLHGCPSPQPFRLSATPILPAGPLQPAHFPLAARLPGAWPHASPSARCLSGQPPSFSPVSSAYDFRMWHAARRRARAEAAGLDGVAAVCTGPQYGAAGEIDAFHSEDAREAQIAALKKAYSAAVHELRLLERWFPDAVARLLPRASAASWLASAGLLRTPRDTPVFESSRIAWRQVLTGSTDAPAAGGGDGDDGEVDDDELDVPASQFAAAHDGGDGGGEGDGDPAMPSLEDVPEDP